MWRPLQRGHSWDRVERLLSEILALLTPGTVTHEGVTTQAPVEVWQAALDELLVERRPTLDLPLTSHGYLVAMVAGRARKDANRARSDAEALARGETPIGWSPAHASPAAQPTAPAGAERLRDLNGDLATLRRLAKFNPNVHDADIARIESEIAALSGRSPQ
jgi:hypothetical protein